MKNNRVLTLLLCLTLVFTSVVPAFADAGSKVASFNKPVYTAWGDSMGAGCKTPGINCQKRYDEYRTSPETKKDWSVNAVPYTFVSKFAKSINADVEHSYNGTQPGMRTKDYCYILGLISDDEFEYYNYNAKKENNTEDWWSATNMSSDQLNYLVNLKDKYVESIKKADVITIELGANDLTTYLINDVYREDSVILGIFQTLMDKNKIPKTKELLEKCITDFKNLSKNFNQTNINTLIEDLKALKLDINVYTELVEKLAKSLAESTGKTRCYWNTLMSWINQHKKTGAVVIVTETPNPALGLDLGMDIDLASIVQPFVNDKNAYVRLKAGVYNYVVADMEGVLLNSQYTENSGLFDEDWVGVPAEDNRVASYSMHPNPDEHDKIYNNVRKAYKKAMAAKGKVVKDCNHSNVSIEGQREATYILSGYTGDAICQDCGEITEHGNIIDKRSVAKTSIKSLTKGSKSFTVKWSKKNVTGYQLQYSTSSKFKNAKKVTVNGATTKTVKKLKSGKKYYVHVRTYKNVKNDAGKTVKVYSKWSASKSVTTK